MAEHASDETGLLRWTHFAREQVRFRGLSSRVCRPGYRAGNESVADGKTSAPTVTTRDHLDAGWSVPNPSVNCTARADAGYEAAIEETRQSDVHIPMDE